MKHSSNFRLSLLPIYASPILLALFGSMDVQAATYYVSLSGSDSNPGTQSQPFKTFDRAVAPLRPGDTLYIRGGTWTQQIDLMDGNKSGASGAYIKIAGYPGETVTIRYADSITSGYGPIKVRGNRGYFIFENLILDGINSTNNTTWQIRDGNHDFILRNLEIKNFKSNGLFIKANNVQVINCSIHDQRKYSTSRVYGIYFNGANGLFQGNKIYNNPGGGIHAYPGPISNLIIRGNAVYNNNSMSNSNVGGILVWGIPSSIIYNTQIYNNLVYRNATASTAGAASGIDVGPYTSGTKVWNNTTYGNKLYGVRIHNSTTKSTVVQNNIAYGNGKGDYFNGGSGTSYTNNLTTDPKFVNASINNFQIRSDSPAANKGLRVSSVPNDYRNVPRPRGTTYDIGGYENY